MLVTTTALAMRAMYADLVYTSQRMQVIANREGNPFGIAIRAFGAATALAAARLPSPRFNRVVGLNPAENSVAPRHSCLVCRTECVTSHRDKTWRFE